MRTRSGQQGLAIVEFAIMLPVLMLLLLASAELGRALYQYNALTKSVRNGARHLAENALSGSTTGVIDVSGELAATTRNLVVSSGDLPGLSAEDIDIAVVDAQHVRVSVEYAYTPLFLSLPTFGGDDIALPTALQAAVTMRAL